MFFFLPWEMFTINHLTPGFQAPSSTSSWILKLLRKINAASRTLWNNLKKIKIEKYFIPAVFWSGELHLMIWIFYPQKCSRKQFWPSAIFHCRIFPHAARKLDYLVERAGETGVLPLNCSLYEELLNKMLETGTLQPHSDMPSKKDVLILKDQAVDWFCKSPGHSIIMDKIKSL